MAETTFSNSRSVVLVMPLVIAALSAVLVIGLNGFLPETTIQQRSTDGTPTTVNSPLSNIFSPIVGASVAVVGWLMLPRWAQTSIGQARFGGSITVGTSVIVSFTGVSLLIPQAFGMTSGLIPVISLGIALACAIPAGYLAFRKLT
ncbi:hypothetical protein [Corynebacterium sputi]|uniref:hypothetical protein n=1 Tax=Corynebacterium sputi TaxID=489915 RepID=UPI00047C009E|nr:hypothetical protein [Corynebacterium sputi]